MRLRYWLKSGFQTFGLVIGACLLYGFLMGIQLQDALSDMFVLMPVYLLLFGGMMLLAMNIGVYKFNLQLALAFGSTRNEAILGLNLFRLIPTILLTAVLVVFCALPMVEAPVSAAQAIPLGLGVYLFFGALGSAIGVIFTKYGKIVAIVTAVLLVLICGVCGFLAGFSGSNSFLGSLIFSDSLPWLVLGIGLLAYALSQIPEQRTVWKCNVKL